MRSLLLFSLLVVVSVHAYTPWIRASMSLKQLAKGVGVVPCGDGTACADGQTCCPLASSGYGCCPSPNAVCCSDKIHCCPNGYTCDVSAGTCTQNGIYA